MCSRTVFQYVLSFNLISQHLFVYYISLKYMISYYYWIFHVMSKSCVVFFTKHIKSTVFNPALVIYMGSTGESKCIANVWLSIATQQIGVHEASLCVLLVLEILCSSTKLTFVLTLCAWCVFHVFGVLYLCIILSSHLVSCVFTFLSSTWWNQNGFKSAHREHKKSWTHAYTNLLGISQ